MAIRLLWPGTALSSSLLTLTLASAAPQDAAALGRTIDLSETSAPTIIGSEAHGQFGYCLAVADIDGDGEEELLVGAPGHSTEDGTAHQGAVYVFERSSLDSLAEKPVEADSVAAAVIESTSDRARFGSTIAAADIDGDGTDDLVIGAPDDGADGKIACGRVFIIFGGDRLRSAVNISDVADLIIVGEQAGDRLGSSLLLGDLDGDGRADLLVSAYRAAARGPGAGPGKIYIIPGSGARTLEGEHTVLGAAHCALVGADPGDALRGIALADIDGDGKNEIIAGAYMADGPGEGRTDAGEVYAVHADSMRMDAALNLPEPASTTIHGRWPRGLLGRSIATGDIDSDGVADLLVSAYAAREKGNERRVAGEAYVIFGENEGWERELDLAHAEPPGFHGRSAWDLLGLPVLLSDLNGDDNADIVVASQLADSPDGSRRDCGEVYIFWGGLRSVIAAKAGCAELADVTIVGGNRLDAIGASLGAADVVGDCRPDLIIGGPDCTGSRTAAPRTGKIFLVPGELLLRQGSTP